MLMVILTVASQLMMESKVSYAASSDALVKSPAWQAPSSESVKAKVLGWLEEKNVDDLVRTKAQRIWADAPEQSAEEETLSRLTATFALVDTNAEKLVVLCSQPRGSMTVPGQAWLSDPQTPPFVANNMRLLYAKWLVQESLYEEAQEQISGLEPGDVAAPATLLFYQSVICHKLLEKESGLKTLECLLSGPETSPRRYVAIARLMQDDLKELEQDSLDHIARRMEDVRRRLDLGRAGPKVRKVEDGVIESLDKLIKKLEEQQQQQSSGSSNTLRPTTPAQESMPMGGKGPGDVTKRDIGSKSGWGDLPPQQREEALQQIGRDFPSHYRDVIEQYFKRLASEGNE